MISLDSGNLGDEDMGVKVEFRDVWFNYPTRDVSILKGLNIAVSCFQPRTSSAVKLSDMLDID